MPLDECPDGLGTEQASFANTRLGKQVVGHFIEIMRQPVVDRRRETGFRLAQRGKVSFIALPNMYSVVERKSLCASTSAAPFRPRTGQFTIHERHPNLLGRRHA